MTTPGTSRSAPRASRQERSVRATSSDQSTTRPPGARRTAPCKPASQICPTSRASCAIGRPETMPTSVSRRRARRRAPGASPLRHASNRRGCDGGQRAVDVEHGDEAAAAARGQRACDVERLGTRGRRIVQRRIDDGGAPAASARANVGSEADRVSNRALETPGGEGTASGAPSAARNGARRHAAGTSGCGSPGRASDRSDPRPGRSCRIRSCHPADRTRGRQLRWVREPGAHPLCHIFTTRCVFDPAYWGAYRRVNRRFANTIARLASRTSVWVNDFPLSRSRIPAGGRDGLRVGLFWHIRSAAGVFGICQWRDELLRDCWVPTSSDSDRSRRSQLRRLRAPFLVCRWWATRPWSGWTGDRSGWRRTASASTGAFTAQAGDPTVRARAAPCASVSAPVVMIVDRLDYTRIIERLLGFEPSSTGSRDGGGRCAGPDHRAVALPHVPRIAS